MRLEPNILSKIPHPLSTTFNTSMYNFAKEQRKFEKIETENTFIKDPARKLIAEPRLMNNNRDKLGFLVVSIVCVESIFIYFSPDTLMG